jgi:hypothetical protein
MDDVLIGNLTGPLARVKATVPTTKFEGREVEQERELCRCRCADKGRAWARGHPPSQPNLKRAESRKGSIKMVGAIYDLANGVVGVRRLDLGFLRQ